MGCDDDAELLQQITEPDGSVVIRLMWSYMCQGVWAKVSRDLDTSPDYVYGTLWTTRDPEGGVQQADTTGLLADGVAGAYTKMQNWKKTSAKACWNDVDAQYDPMPLKYIVNNNDASMPTVHGSCTDWL